MDTETDTLIDLRPQYRFLARHASKAFYIIVLIVGAALAQFTRNIELTMAVGLVVRIFMELTGAAVALGLMALGGWTAVRLITEEKSPQ